jgi:hypothetical protein
MRRYAVAEVTWVEKLLMEKMAQQCLERYGILVSSIDDLRKQYGENQSGWEADLSVAKTWVAHAIKAVRSAPSKPQPNPFVRSSDDDIAQEIMRRIRESRNPAVLMRRRR